MSRRERVVPPTAVVTPGRDFRLRRRLRRDKMASQVGGDLANNTPHGAKALPILLPLDGGGLRWG